MEFDSADASGLLTQNGVDAREHQVQFGARQFAYTSGEEILVYGNDLRDVGHGCFWKPGKRRRQIEISWRQGPFEIAGQRNADDGQYNHIATGRQADAGGRGRRTYTERGERPRYPTPAPARSMTR